MKEIKYLFILITFVNFFSINELIASTNTTNTTSISTTNSTPQNANMIKPSKSHLPSLFTTPPSNGEHYLSAVMQATQHFHHNEALAAFAVASMIPVNPSDDYASVCMQKTKHGIFRVHSKNPEALGIVKGKTERNAFESLFKIEVRDTFNFNVPPSNINSPNSGANSVTTYYGQLFLKHGDGTVEGDIVCFARYK